MIFRQAVAADLERAIEIMNAAIVRLGAAGVDQWQHGYPNAERLKSDVEEGIGYVLCDEDRLYIQNPQMPTRYAFASSRLQPRSSGT